MDKVINSLGVYNKKKIFTVLFFLYIFFSLFRFIYPANFILTTFVTIIGLLSFVLLSIKIKREDLVIYIYIFFLFIFVFLSAFAVNRFERLGHVVLFILTNTGIALILKNSLVNTWAVKVVFYSWTLFFIIQILTGVDPDLAVTVVSHNGISMMILVACISYYIVVREKIENIPLIPALFTLIISIWGIGRSGILASLILLIGVILIKYPLKKATIFILSSPLLLIFLFFDQVVSFALNVPFLTRSATNYLVRNQQEEARIEIWGNYFNNLDIFRFLFGANIKTDPWPDGQTLAYNYHNTFINLHSQTGLMGVITIIILIFALFKFSQSNKLLFVLLLALVARWFTDIGLYFESWDFLPFYFTFIVITQKNNLFNKL